LEPQRRQPSRRIDPATAVQGIKTRGQGISGGQWQKDLATLINHNSMHNFPAMLETFLGTLCHFDTFMMAVYRQSARPTLIYPADPAKQSQALHKYLNRAFVLDPLFHAIREGLNPGITRLVEIMPDSFEATEYYRTCYQGFGLVDEINLVIHLEAGVTCAATLGRKSSLGSVTRSELKTLTAFFPIVDSLVRQFWLCRSGDYFQCACADDSMQRAINTFASGVLTVREQQITGLILRGFSSKAIASELNITVGTVKVHRKNIHARLNTSTQSDIFIQFIAHLNWLDTNRKTAWECDQAIPAGIAPQDDKENIHERPAAN
jgi:DNA-binding CsgD family transcriptional regulator